MSETRQTPKSGTTHNPAPATPMTPQAASRIQSAAAKAHGGVVPKNSFAARAMRAASGGRRK